MPQNKEIHENRSKHLRSRSQSFATRLPQSIFMKLKTMLTHTLKGAHTNLTSSACESRVHLATGHAVSVSHTFMVLDTAHVSSFPVTGQDHQGKVGERQPGWSAQERTGQPMRRARECLRRCCSAGWHRRRRRPTMHVGRHSITHTQKLRTTNLRTMAPLIFGCRRSSFSNERSCETSPKLL